MKTGIVRPVDAAGLVLLRRARGGLEVLLGRRHARAGFLADFYVFPGGRLEPGDALGDPLPLARTVAADLALGSARSPSALLRAALRETEEETGLRLPPTAIPRIDFVCRAITPTSSHRRYHTRFFLAAGAPCDGALTGAGELEDLGWRSLKEASGLNLVDVTTFVLEEAVRRWPHPPGSKPAPRLTY